MAVDDAEQHRWRTGLSGRLTPSSAIGRWRRMHILRREGETFEQLMRRFKQGVERSGLLRDMKRKRYHVSRGQAKRLKAQAAQRRQRRRALRQKARA